MKVENPVLVERLRGDVLESFHRGVVCIVNADNEIVFSLGDVHQVCYPRSALKLFQHIPMLESGAIKEYGFTLEEIAIMCGSHNGEPAHVKAVEGILAKIGLSKSCLHCGPQLPTLTEDRNEMIRCDHLPEAIHNNCSGKHAGFLAYCVYKGYDIAGYLYPDHPLQKEIKQVTAEMHEYPVEDMQTAVDGCSAPIFALPVYNQAVGYKNLLNPEKFGPARANACRTIIEAVTRYPYMIAGSKRYCTELMEVCGDRVFGKTGADGIYSLGLINEKLGCTIKIDDGLMGPQYTVAQEIVEKLGLCRPEAAAKLHFYIESPITNWNRIDTGLQRVNKALFENLSLNRTEEVAQ